MRPKQKAYLETTILSYATSWLSGRLLIAAQQQYTQDWLMKFPRHFDCFVSELVVSEALQGDPEAAARRMQRLSQFAILTVDSTARQLADELVRLHSIPVRAKTDALHVAIAAVNQIDYLVTWNCTHINNAVMRTKIEHGCFRLGYRCPVICTPMELEITHD